VGVRRALATTLALLGLAVAAAPAGAADPESALRRTLSAQMRHAGVAAGATVVDLSTGGRLYDRKGTIARVPASVEKLYTTATALARLGPESTFETTVTGEGELDERGVWRGDLYLRGFGDPTFGSAGVARLVEEVRGAGIERVAGRVYGDESFFDGRRGVPAAGYRVSRYVGPLSALSYGHGYARGSFQSKPPVYAAAKLVRQLRHEGVRVDEGSGARTAPLDATPIAGVSSPTLATIARLTNRPSDNFYAEMLLKGLGARLADEGSTSAGIDVVRDQLDDFGISPRIGDGSGLSRGNRTSPRAVVTLLQRMRTGSAASAFVGSLSVAGENGTLARRMRGTAAQGHCRGKTGTLSNVSTLAGYCIARDGRTLAFAFLMNRTGIARAHLIQDRMAIALARYRGPAGVTPEAGATPAAAPRR
jgi:D-alanyl-D-alanine carboxypeptidase/D-alanyl-D-alanine-endopeptidase (penicillin-binding protein 4)